MKSLKKNLSNSFCRFFYIYKVIQYKLKHVSEITILIYRSPSRTNIPTVKMLSPKLNASPNNNNDEKNQNHYVINPAYNKTPPPEQRLKGLHAKKRLVNSTHNNGDVRERSESFVLKARSNKQLKILGTAIKSETACTTELLENQNQLISEFMLKRNIAKSSPDPQRKETNPTIHLAQNDHGVFGEKIRRYTMDHHQKSQLQQQM